jgi:hypothetical protein
VTQRSLTMTDLDGLSAIAFAMPFAFKSSPRTEA